MAKPVVIVRDGASIPEIIGVVVDILIRERQSTGIHVFYTLITQAYREGRYTPAVVREIASHLVEFGPVTEETRALRIVEKKL